MQKKMGKVDAKKTKGMLRNGWMATISKAAYEIRSAPRVPRAPREKKKAMEEGV